MSVAVRSQMQALISRAVLTVGAELLGLPLQYFTAPDRFIWLVGIPQSDSASIVDFMNAQNESTPKIFTFARQDALVDGNLLQVPGTVFRFQPGHWVVFQGYEWVVKTVTESTGLDAVYDLGTTRTRLQRAL